MKNILALSASPRRGGNSDILCDEFIRGAKDAGHTVEKIFLRDRRIEYCTGCGVCNDTHRCVHNDDMRDILQKMVAADAIVMATPVYFYTMNAQMKTLIDRTVPRYTEISNKEFYFIVTAADSDRHALERTIEGLRGFTQQCLEGAKERGILYGTSAWQMGEIRQTSAMQEAYTMGREA